MPETSSEYVWWALNGAILLLLYFAKSDLKDIKDNMKANTALGNNHEIRITRLEVRCNMTHGEDEHPMRRSTDV